MKMGLEKAKPATLTTVQQQIENGFKRKPNFRIERKREGYQNILKFLGSKILGYVDINFGSGMYEERKKKKKRRFFNGQRRERRRKKIGGYVLMGFTIFLFYFIFFNLVNTQVSFFFFKNQ